MSLSGSTARPTGRLLRAVALTLAVTCSAASTARAQAPEVVIAHPGADEFLTDLAYVVGLTDANQQQQLPNLEDFFGIFLLGIDGTQPARLDVLLDGESPRYRLHLPIAKIKTFNDDNLDATFDYEAQRIALTLYRIRDNAKPGRPIVGWMRYFNKYASIAADRNDLPQNAPHPTDAIGPLLAKNYDVILDGRNVAAGVDQRAKDFRRNGEEILDAMNRAEGESAEAFAFRKLLFGTQMAELERIYAQSERLQIGGIIDQNQGDGRVDLELLPLADTDLDKSARMLGAAPSRFAAVAAHDASVLSARINHPLDELRKKNLAALADSLNGLIKKQYDDSERTDAEKTAAKDAADKFFAMLKGGIQAGLLDTFAEVHSNEGAAHTAVGGIQAPDGTELVPILELLPKARAGRTVKLKVEERSGVEIHEIAPAEGELPALRKFVGDGPIYVGTAKDAVWYAAGPNALDELKTTIVSIVDADEENSEDRDVSRFVSIDVTLEPWAQLLQDIRGDDGQADLRKLAIAAFAAGRDRLTLTFDRNDKRIEGHLLAEPGVLRLIGAVLADFSKENLADEN